ncbi:hypothetical protein C8Q75DRAFT_779893 [Abortiporus biennis]|nr:hypothetical protein C8Q75DRAFT_779893 [Abortiporus biennis]
MSSVQLTAGICSRLADTSELNDDLLDSKPTVQILSVKKVGSASGPNTNDRYRAIVSDGEHFFQAMLATQLNKLVDSGEITKHSIVSIDKFTCNKVQEKRLLIILDMHVIIQEHDKIGNPVNAGEQATPAVQKTPALGAPTTASSSTIPQTTTNPPKRQGSTPAARGKGTPFPIEGLSPYQNHWMIKARVTNKSDIKVWSNQRGEGKLFSVVLMDDTGEIKATGFNAAVDTLYDKFEEGKVYWISKAKVQLAKKQFSTLSNEYELQLDRSTEVEECHDTTGLPTIRYNFVSLGSLEEHPKDSIIDVIGVVTDIASPSEFTNRLGRQSVKREITLVDRSGFSVRCTLWGKHAENFNHPGNPIVALKGVKVSDFGGRSLSTTGAVAIDVDPDIAESHALRGWFDAGGNNEQFKAQSNSFGGGGGSSTFSREEIRSLNDVKDSGLGTSDKPEFFSARATVMHVKNDNIAYPACPTQGCNKKVFDQHDGWRCEKCDRSYERPEYRYIISLAVADYSGQLWLQGFNDLGLALFNKPANDVVEAKDRDEAEFNKIMESAIGVTYNFTCRAKQDTYNDQTRVRYGVQKIIPLNYKEEANYLMGLLSTPWAQ